MTFEAGLCSYHDSEFCIVSVHIFEDAIFPMPRILENGTVAIPTGMNAF